MMLVLLGGLLLLITPRVTATCPDKEVVNNLNDTRFAGVWYHIKETDSYWPGSDKKCGQTTLQVQDDGAISNTYTYINTTTGDSRSIGGVMRRISADSSDGKFLGQFGNNGRYTAQYFVLGTDYDKYSVAWLCQQLEEDVIFERLLLMSRERTLDEASKTQAEHFFTTGSYVDSNQSDCQ